MTIFNPLRNKNRFVFESTMYLFFILAIFKNIINHKSIRIFFSPPSITLEKYFKCLMLLNLLKMLHRRKIDVFLNKQIIRRVWTIRKMTIFDNEINSQQIHSIAVMMQLLVTSFSEMRYAFFIGSQWFYYQ